VAGQSPLVAADRRVTRRAGVLERPELFRRDQPLEVPGGELEGGRGAGALGGVSRCERAEKREDSGPEGAQDVAAESEGSTVTHPTKCVGVRRPDANASLSASNRP